MLLLSKKLAARLPEISTEEILKLAEKAVNKTQSKLQTHGGMFGSCEQKAMGPNNDIVKYEAKELD